MLFIKEFNGENNRGKEIFSGILKEFLDKNKKNILNKEQLNENLKEYIVPSISKLIDEEEEIKIEEITILKTLEYLVKLYNINEIELLIIDDRTIPINYENLKISN